MLTIFERANWSCFVAIMFAVLEGTAFADALRLEEFRHISFEKIPPTVYSEQEGVIKADVASSSSFLLKPYPKVKSVKKVQWRWKLTGNFKVTSISQLKSKDGDDAIVRLGLIKTGSAPMVPFFAPAWVKAIRDHMKLPGEEMQYLLAGGPAEAGATWESPYSSSMSILQVPSTSEADGWHLAQHTFSEPLKIVGLWLMADGDNTKSNFSVLVKDLEVFE